MKLNIFRKNKYSCDKHQLLSFAKRGVPRYHPPQIYSLEVNKDIIQISLWQKFIIWIKQFLP